MAILFAVLKFLLGVAVVHVSLNIVMKLVKSTSYGHRLLSATYGSGETMGREGNELNKALALMMKSWIGPESLIEYEMGLNFGRGIGKFSKEEQEMILAVKQEVLAAHYEQMSDEDKEIFDNTPFLNTLYGHARGEVNEGLEKQFLKYSQPKGKQPIMGYLLVFVISSLLILLLGWHGIAQIGISGLRVLFSKTALGRRIAIENFVQGIYGYKLPWYKRIVYDYVFSPAVLDTHRVGDFVKKLGRKS